MFRFELPNGQVLIVEASNKGEAIRRAQQWIAANISQSAAQDPGINASLDRTGRIVRPTEIQAGDTFVQRGPTGETLPSDPLGGQQAGGQGTGTDGGQQTGAGAGAGAAPSGAPGSAVGQDIQNFPFASFANELTSRGFNTDGVLGSTFRQQFGPLDRVRQFGSLTGTIPGIGNDPGTLQSFFGNRIGQGGDLAQQTINALASGQVASGLDSAALNPFLNPDIATSEGRGDARDVFDLARAAAANRFGALTAGQLIPSNDRLLGDFERRLAGSTGAPGDVPDFLTFARQRFGV